MLLVENGMMVEQWPRKPERPEVDLRSSAVVQVRGKMNRPAKQQESLRVAKWASQNNLVVRSRW